MWLPRALPDRAGHRRRRQQVRPGHSRCPDLLRVDPESEREQVGAAGGVQGRPRRRDCGAAPSGGARRRPGRRKRAAGAQGGAEGSLLDGRGVRGDARRLRRLSADQLSRSPGRRPAAGGRRSARLTVYKPARGRTAAGGGETQRYESNTAPSRTLVKSAPELWMACSEEVVPRADIWTPFGEIRITRLEPETTIAWEGDAACGTVMLEPSGLGDGAYADRRRARAARAGDRRRHWRTRPGGRRRGHSRGGGGRQPAGVARGGTG